MKAGAARACNQPVMILVSEWTMRRENAFMRPDPSAARYILPSWTVSGIHVNTVGVHNYPWMDSDLELKPGASFLSFFSVMTECISALCLLVLKEKLLNE